MIDKCLALLAPHLCPGCGIEGSLLCDSCKNDILDEHFLYCIACGKGLPGRNGLCSECMMPYERAWCVADRRDHLQQLIGNFKFTNAHAAHRPLAELLHEHLPTLPTNTIVVPVPTVSSHIRQRGYDHMLLIARHFARIRGYMLDTVLQRATSTQQRSKGRAERVRQARSAFVCNKSLDPDKPYLLIDDVITTGATVRYAAQKLLDSGASAVWVASISRQPLD